MVTAFVSLLSSMLVLLYPVNAARADTTDATPTRVRVVVTTRAEAASSYAFVSRQPNLGTFTLDADAATLERLSRDPRVAAITPDRELRPALADSTTQIHADAAWASGLTGAGQTIVVVDTGVDGGHPMLSGHVVDEACFTEATSGGAGACPNGLAEQVGAGAAAPCAGSGCDHGTHVASIAAGSTFGALRGVAPDASVVAVQVFTPSPSGPTTSIGEVLDAFEWAYEQRNRFAIAAINLSVASAAPVTTPCADAAVEQAVARLHEVGIAVVVAAGNGGSTTDVAYPACVRGTVAVSSVGSAGAPSSFANRAPALALFAPGETITAAAPGNATQIKSGTSQATPHVAGALALFRQREPSASFDALIALFDRTADVVVGPDGRRAPAGMLRVDRALDPRYQHPSVAFSRSSPPLVGLEALRVLPGRVELVGSVIDPASVLPATLTALIDGSPRASAQTFAGDGDSQRFTLTVPIVGGSPLELCIDIRGARATTSTRVVCTSVTGPDGPPIGSLDVVRAGLGSLVVHGWAIDPDASTPIDVHVYVDDVLVTGARADRTRDDVERAYPGYGAAHGFSATVAVTSGPHIVCTYGIDVDDDENALIGCREFEMPTGAPFGSLDVVGATASGVFIAGWAIDPDARNSIEVHIYVDGRLVRGVTAGRARADVAAAYPQFPSDHGYETTIELGEGPHLVCTYGINEGPGTNALLGCRTT